MAPRPVVDYPVAVFPVAAFGDVNQGVGDDVSDVVVDEGVLHLAAAAMADDDAGVLQHTQVLAHLRLIEVQGVDELVHAHRPLVEGEDDRDARRGGEGAQQFACGGMAGGCEVGLRHWVPFRTICRQLISIGSQLHGSLRGRDVLNSMGDMASLASKMLHTRWLVRAPIPLFRAGLGFVFGGRLLLLEHLGRTSGEHRFVVLECVERPAKHRVAHPKAYDELAGVIEESIGSTLEAIPYVELILT